MNIIVAGGAGFLGSHLSEKLVEEGNDVTVVDDLSSGLEGNLSNIRRRIHFIKSDIVDFDSDDKFDVIFNLASNASRIEWEKRPVEVALSNSSGNNNLIKLALKNRALYVYASSSEVYGNPDVIPTSESYLGRVSTTGSRSPYDEGKRFGEALVKSYEREYGLRNIIIRLFNTYGPRMRGGDFYGRVIDRFIQQAITGRPITVYGDGMQTRSFTYVKDTVDAIDLVVKSGSVNQVYNIGNDREMRILDIAELIKKMSNSTSEIEFMKLPEDDPRRRSADISRIRKLGFSHRFPIELGIQYTLDYAIENSNGTV